MSLNRNIAPNFDNVKELHFPSYKRRAMENGTFFYSIKAGTEPVIRLDFVFSGGVIQQSRPGIAGFTASMLSEGTQSKSALELAEELDYYGSYFQVRSGSEESVASLYCLEKHLGSCLPIFMEALCDSIFPTKELEIQKKNSIQKLMVSQKKNSYLCRKGFYKNLLGESHPLAVFNEKSDIQAIDANALLEFYKTNYLEGLNYVLLSGNFSAGSEEIVSRAIVNSGLKKNAKTLTESLPYTAIGKHFIEKSDSVQSATRIGKASISRSHPEFRKLQFLNLIFGGYFGSRLMKNIREDKGLTYGIYSVIEPYKNLGIWYIDSEINTKNRKLGLEEIYLEMQKIRTSMIPTEEFETAKNYYLGSFLRGLDGPFSIADRLRIMIENNLPDNYYSGFIEVLNETSPEELLAIAQQYLTEENLVEMVVGQK